MAAMVAKKVDADGDLRDEGCGSSAKQDTAKRVKLVPMVMKMFVSMRIWRRRRSKRRLFVSELRRGVEIKLHGARRRKAGSGFGKLWNQRQRQIRDLDRV